MSTEMEVNTAFEMMMLLVTEMAIRKSLQSLRGNVRLLDTLKFSLCCHKYIVFLSSSVNSVLFRALQRSAKLFCILVLGEAAVGKSYKLFIHWLLAEILWMLINSCNV